MPQQIINRGTTPNDGTGDTAYIFTGKTNANFTEVYGNLNLPIKTLNQTGAFTQDIPANTWVERIIVLPQSGTPTIEVGTTLGGSDILPPTLIGNSLPIMIQEYFTNETTLYFTVSGGNVNKRTDQINPLM
jgi:hypothetical protein